MSKSKSGLGKTRIPFLTHCCNIIVGCLHNCLAHLKDKKGKPVECWAARTARRTKCPLCQSFTPHIHPERWAQITPGGAPKVIGLGFMGDLCGDWEWTEETSHGAWGRDYATHSPQYPVLSLAQLIATRPRHTFVSLTQRPDRLPRIEYPDNWWWGTTVHNQREADKRIGELLASGVKHPWVSYEPATGPVDFTKEICLGCGKEHCGTCPCGTAKTFRYEWSRREYEQKNWPLAGVIAGGMSGPGAVPANPDWFRRVRDDCAEAGVPFYYKQGPDDSGRAFTHMPVLDGRQHLELPWKMPEEARA